jgi:hypothetical protein
MHNSNNSSSGRSKNSAADSAYQNALNYQRRLYNETINNVSSGFDRLPFFLSLSWCYTHPLTANEICIHPASSTMKRHC